MAYHGEYKIPGGKLVKVDFDIQNNRLTNVVLSGDFFVYPDEAYELLRASLEGMPASLSPQEMTERVRNSLAPSVDVLGTSPDAISTAIRRALESAAVG
jgi:lipoate-protein ligase A